MLRRPPLHVLCPCASCAEQTDANLRCIHCHTHYCSLECKTTHWNAGGHDKACEALARARSELFENLGAQTSALARVSQTSGGAPHDALCRVCYGGSSGSDPLLRGCAGQGPCAGWVHAGCLIGMAGAARPLRDQPLFASWLFCPTCKQRFTGLAKLRLTIALWGRVAHEVETNDGRLLATDAYASALGDAGEHAEAARLQRRVLEIDAQTSGPEHRNTLASASNLALSLQHLGEHTEAVVLLRTTLAAQTRARGADDEGALFTVNSLVCSLLELGEYAETEALGRVTLEKVRRVLGQDHRETLMVSANLAFSLSKQGKHAETLELQREILLQTTRLFGAEHKDTVIVATNYALSLSQCGQQTECEQILRETLTLSRRALGPTHEATQLVIRGMRAFKCARS